MSSQDGDEVMVRIRADESVRAIIPTIVQTHLKIEPDQSKEANELAKRSPTHRAVPLIFIIIGAMALVQLLQVIRELLRQIYYGEVVIDTRSQPPTVTSDPQIPANMVFVIGTDGKTTQYKNDQFSLDVLKLALKLT